ERAGAGDVANVGGLGEVDLDFLDRGVDRRMAELDRELEPKAEMRIEPRPLVAVADLDRLEHTDELLGRRLLDDAGRLDQEHEGTGRAVEDGDLGRGDVDVEVVDAQAGQR